MRTRNLVAASAATLALVPAAAGCGGGASDNHTTAGASVTAQSGTTSAGAAAAGHAFTAQISSLSALLGRLSSMDTSSGSAQVATALGEARRQLAQLRGTLATTAFPSVLQSQKQELMGLLDRWGSDLSRAQRTARAGRTGTALDQAESTAYHALQSLVAITRSSSAG